MAKILAIDDQQSNLTAISALLERMIPDCVVTTASSGTVGLEQAVKTSPDAILLDIQMPEVDGFDVCQKLKADVTTRNIPVIMLSGVETETKSRIRGLNSGADVYLTKPIESAELTAYVKAMLRTKKTQDRLAQEKQTHERIVVEQSDHIKHCRYNLAERVKELDCLYEISRLVDKEGGCLERILQGVVDLIPPSWQYPELSCSRCVVNGREYKTPNYVDTPRSQQSDIFVRGEWIGFLKVCYLAEIPESDENPFLKEEENLLKAIAERLGQIIEHRQTEVALTERETQYQVFSETVTDGIAVIQMGQLVSANTSFCSMFDFNRPEDLIGTPAIELISDHFKERFKKMLESLELGTSDSSVFHGMCKARHGRLFRTEGRYTATQWNGKTSFFVTIRETVDPTGLKKSIRNGSLDLNVENMDCPSTIKERCRLDNIIGKSRQMNEVYKQIVNVSTSEANVVIYGESGTGKELVARSLHQRSGRSTKEFVAVNCSAIPETLLESEFFGYKKGSFTGARIDKFGFLDIADGGTLFLDEVGDLSLTMQVKLLRAIEGGGHIPIGGRRARKSDFRMIAATNKDMRELVREGRVRKDFFYRIEVIPIHIPPLRNRLEDLDLLIEHYLRSKVNDKEEPPTIPERVRQELHNYRWPGNVRELQNVLDRYLTLGYLNHRAPHQEITTPLAHPSSNTKGRDLRRATADFERDLILRALKENNWHRGKAARMLGIDRKTLFRKVQAFGVN